MICRPIVKTKRDLLTRATQIHKGYICHLLLCSPETQNNWLNITSMSEPQTCIPTHELLTKLYLGQECKSVVRTFHDVEHRSRRYLETLTSPFHRINWLLLVI